jgi:hypothetical protein
MPDTGPQDLALPTAPEPAPPLFTPDPYFVPDDRDDMPFALRVLRAWENLAPARPDAAPLGRVLQAFGQGAAHGWGSEPLGLAPDTEQGLRQVGIFADPESARGGPARFVNEALIRPAATAVDAAQRGGKALVSGGARALGQAYVEAGGSEAGGDDLVRDLIALATVASIAAGGAPIARPGLIRRAPAPSRTAKEIAPEVAKPPPTSLAFTGGREDVATGGRAAVAPDAEAFPGIAHSAPAATGAGISPVSAGPGAFVKVRESMSERAAAYQSRVTGTPPGTTYAAGDHV